MWIFAVLVFAFFHTVVFAWHSFAVLRYDRLYEQIQANGATIQMPEDFLQNYNTAQHRTFWSRPDILAREIGVIQSWAESLTTQYKNDVYRLHDTIVQHIRYLTAASEIGQEMLFPGHTEVLTQASTLQSKLDAMPLWDITQLTELVKLSTSMIEWVQKNIAYAERKLILQDILAFKHEMLFLADVYRLTPIKKPLLDTKVFWKDFSISFNRNTLKNSSTDELKSLLQYNKTLTQGYRDEASKIRAIAREKRAEWVDTEQKKWETSTTWIPASPLPELYQLIYISLAKQMMYVYEDNELIISTSITSWRNNYETIRGKFRVYTKQRGKLMKSPFPEEEYELWVDYWLGFSGGYGIHDACNSTDCWRTRFGLSSYVYNGSHGCINTPYNAVKMIYSWAKVGTTVYVK